MCERGRSGFRVTPAGQQFYESAMRFKSALDSYQDEVFNIHTNNLDTLRIGAVDNVLQDPDNPIIKALLQLQAQHAVRINTTIADLAGIVRKVI